MATGKFHGEAQLETKYTYFFYRKLNIQIAKNLETPVLGKYNLSNYSFLTKEILDIFYLISLVSFQKTLFYKVKEGAASEHEYCYGTFKTRKKLLSSQNLIILRNFSTGPNS